MMNENMAREVREARAAGIRALNSLRKAEQHLDSARGWGIFDILGGGTITTLIKHSKMDDARRCMQEAEYDLRRFREELADIRIPDLNIDGFMSFADFFFDGLLADFLVQRRINEAREKIARACRQVEDVLRQLPNA